MIQVASENYSQENFLGLGNKKKRQEKKAARQEKRAAKKDARQGLGLFGKIANRIGVGKPARAIKKDFKAAKAEIKTTGTFTKGSVKTGTIRNPTPVNISPTRIPFGGVMSGKKQITKLPMQQPIAQSQIIRGTEPNQRANLVQPEYPQEQPEYIEQSMPSEPRQAKGKGNAQVQAQQAQAQIQAQQAQQETGGQEQVEKNPDGTPKEKPFNWKLWGGVGGGVVLIIVVILIVVLKK